MVHLIFTELARKWSSPSATQSTVQSMSPVQSPESMFCTDPVVWLMMSPVQSPESMFCTDPTKVLSAERGYCTSCVPSSERSEVLLRVHSNVYGFAKILKCRSRLRDEHRLSRFLYTLLSSFPTPRQTDKYYRMTIAPMPDSTI